MNSITVSEEVKTLENSCMVGVPAECGCVLRVLRLYLLLCFLIQTTAQVKKPQYCDRQTHLPEPG